MHHEEKLLGDGKTYQAWEHDWAQENHPRISITCDGNAPMATQCNIYYTDPDGNYTLIDFERRGSQAPMGSVNCNTDHYVSLHYNKGD
jgi:hypothetical protein